MSEAGQAVLDSEFEPQIGPFTEIRIRTSKLVGQGQFIAEKHTKMLSIPSLRQTSHHATFS